jgi:predicted O-methyltransferase YrrM
VIPALEDLERYAVAHSTAVHEGLEGVAERTCANEPDFRMLTGALEGGFLSFLVFALQPRLVVEVGTYTGYSALSMAEAMPSGGRIITCEVDPEHADLAEQNIADSGIERASCIEVRRGPALESIATVDDRVDLAFIDADKTSYVDYYEALVPNLSERGVIVADNVLWGGRVLDESDTTPDTEAIRRFNAHVTADSRTTNVLLTIRDGIQLIRRA